MIFVVINMIPEVLCAAVLCCIHVSRCVLGDFVLSAMTESNNISFPGSEANIFTRDPRSCPGPTLRASDSLYRSVCNWSAVY